MSFQEYGVFNQLINYEPPPWCKGLKVIPKHRIPLAMTPTPIHRWNVEGMPEGFEVYVKRDDLTGCTLSGNKVRKLEFLLADAKAKGCTDVITSGSTQSNHARATVIAANQVGLDCHLILRDKDQNCKTTPCSGNFMLMLTAHADIYLLPWTSFSDENVMRKNTFLAKHIEETPGKLAYQIPPGGDNEIGVFGYIKAWEEMMQQKIHERFDDVVFAMGTSGTGAGLIIGNYLTGSKLRLHSITVSRPKEMVHALMDDKLSRLGIEGLRSKDIIDVIDGHIGGGYSVYTDEDVEFCQRIAKTTGIYCDPVYVGKALGGFLKELNTNPWRFKGKRILFIHTGGLFGLTESKVGKMMHNERTLDSVKEWRDVFPDI